MVHGSTWYKLANYDEILKLFTKYILITSWLLCKMLTDVCVTICLHTLFYHCMSVTQ